MKFNTLGWIHFGMAATQGVLIVGQVVNLIPGWGIPAAAALGISGHLVAGYLARKAKELEPPAQ